MPDAPAALGWDFYPPSGGIKPPCTQFFRPYKSGLTALCAAVRYRDRAGSSCAVRVRACAVRVSGALRATSACVAVVFRATLCLLPFSLREKRFKDCLGAATRNLSFGHKNRLNRVSRSLAQNSAVKGCYYGLQRFCSGRGMPFSARVCNGGVRGLFFLRYKKALVLAGVFVLCWGWTEGFLAFFPLFEQPPSWGSCEPLWGIVVPPTFDSNRKVPCGFCSPFPQGIFLPFCRYRQHLVFSCECPVLYPIPLFSVLF